MNRLFIAHYARYDINANSIRADGTGDLVEGSQRDMDEILGRLLASEVDPRRCILMSSIVKFAVETAHEIKQELEIPALVRSPAVRLMSLWPEPIRSVPHFLANVVAATVKDPMVDCQDVDLVVIGHGQLLQAVAGSLKSVGSDTITRPINPYGQVYEMPQDWQNPTFDPEREVAILEDISKWSLQNPNSSRALLAE
jgi:hypothetical protein